MSTFAWNLIFALVWASLAEAFTVSSLLAGFVIGYGVLYVTRDPRSRGGYFRKSRLAVLMVGFVASEIIRSAIRVAYDVVTSHHHMCPGIISIPLDARTDVEITVFAGLLLLTPGTLSVDVSKDRKKLFIHAMYIEDGDVERFRMHLKDKIERRVLELLR